MNKRRQYKHHPQAAGGVRWPGILRAIVLGGGVALIVISAMLPSESAISDGTYAPVVAGWCLLLVVWAASLLLDDEPAVRLGWTEAIGAALIGWYSLAALVSLGHTNGRQAMNAHWLVLGYGLAAFLFRQTIRNAEQVRSVVVSMVWLATLLASAGLYQYFYSMPRMRAAYERDPAAVLAANGIPSDVDSTQRKLFEDRLGSVEPLATFALTNSLAGFLAPWLVAILAVALANLWHHEQRMPLIGLAIAAAILAACLTLTKSRTALAAVTAGLLLIALHGHRRRWRLDWRITAAAIGAAATIAVAAVYFRGLDVEVLSEAPKAVLYRLEYWQATARIIRDYPLFGCGPGNFQEVYAAYKLPQASETVADPHNIFLELWATAGTPAVVLLLGLIVTFVADVIVAAGQAMAVENLRVAPPKCIVLGGAGIGLFAAPAVAAAFGYPLETVSHLLPIPVVWLLGFPLLAGTWWLLDAWTVRGELPLAATIIPQIVLLINLLAAGALIFPAVMSTFLILVPVALTMAAVSASAIAPSAAALGLRGTLAISKSIAAVLIGASILVALACMYTDYYPVLNSRRALDDAKDRLGRLDIGRALPAVVAAAQADSLVPEPWELLAELRLSEWQIRGSEKDWESFLEAANTYRRLNPRHHLAWYTRGNWFLTAWKKSNRKEDLQEALDAYRAASCRFPNRAAYHAQLAWTLHLVGDERAAAAEAERAHELDEKMPHKEQKLSHQHVFDPVPTAKPPTSFREESAEQTIARLRIKAAQENE